MLYETTQHPTRPYDTEIHIVSDMNDWIDYSFIVSSCREDDAVYALEKAWDAWWDCDPACTLFEFLEQALVDAGIPFESGVNAVDETEEV